MSSSVPFYISLSTPSFVLSPAIISPSVAPVFVSLSILQSISPPILSPIPAVGYLIVVHLVIHFIAHPAFSDVIVYLARDREIVGLRRVFARNPIINFAGLGSRGAERWFCLLRLGRPPSQAQQTLVWAARGPDHVVPSSGERMAVCASGWAMVSRLWPPILPPGHSTLNEQ